MNVGQQNSYVLGSLGYVKPGETRNFNYMFEPPEGTPWDNCVYENKTCRIRNARHLATAVGLEQTGFELMACPSRVSDFSDVVEVKSQYYAEVCDTALALTEGRQAVVFDHTIRRREEGKAALGFGRRGDGSNPSAVGRVHNDYSEVSGQRRLRTVMGDSSNDRPFMILNFWRPIVHAAVDTPLAVCDARSFPKRDWVVTDIIYPDRVGEIYLGAYSEAHTWFYFPSMQTDEVLVFKSFDSRRDCPVRMTPHCAFDDPTAADDVPPRQSIETRVLVLLD